MNSYVVRPEIGAWYARLDKGEAFRVVSYDDRSRTIEIQSFDGDIDEIAEDVWQTLPLERSEPPEYSATGGRATRSSWLDPSHPLA